MGNQQNGESKVLGKIVSLIVILSAMVTPWIYHDRTIGLLQGDIKVLNTKIDALTLDTNEMKRILNKYINTNIHVRNTDIITSE